MLFSTTGPLRVWQSKILASEPTQEITLGVLHYRAPKAWIVEETSWTLPNGEKIETRAIPTNQATQDTILQKIETNIRAKHQVTGTRKGQNFTVYQLESGRTILVQTTEQQINVFSGTDKSLSDATQLLNQQD